MEVAEATWLITELRALDTWLETLETLLDTCWDTLEAAEAVVPDDTDAEEKVVVTLAALVTVPVTVLLNPPVVVAALAAPLLDGVDATVVAPVAVIAVEERHASEEPAWMVLGEE